MLFNTNITSSNDSVLLLFIYFYVKLLCMKCATNKPYFHLKMSKKQMVPFSYTPILSQSYALINTCKMQRHM